MVCLLMVVLECFKLEFMGRLFPFSLLTFLSQNGVLTTRVLELQGTPHLLIPGPGLRLRRDFQQKLEIRRCNRGYSLRGFAFHLFWCPPFVLVVFVMCLTVCIG